MLTAIGILLFTAMLNRPSRAQFDPSEYPEVPGAAAASDAYTLYKAVLDRTGQCTLAGGLRALAIVGGDPIGIYQAVKDEDRACLSVDAKLAALVIPKSLDRTAASAFHTVLEGCQSEYLAQWSAANSLHEALNGGKIEDLARYRSSEKDKHDGGDCIGNAKAAALLAGVHDDVL